MHRYGDVVVMSEFPDGSDPGRGGDDVEVIVINVKEVARESEFNNEELFIQPNHLSDYSGMFTKK